MNAMNHHEAWEMKPRKLSIEEVEHPERVIDEFFQFAQLPQARWFLWEGMKTMVTGNFCELDSRERSTLMCFHEQVEKLLEGVHVLYERNQLQQG